MSVVPEYKRSETEKKPAKNLPRLSNCPFCNSPAKRFAAQFTPATATPIISEDGKNYHYATLTWYAVKCKACGITQPKRKYMTREESDEAWNRRSIM